MSWRERSVRPFPAKDSFLLAGLLCLIAGLLCACGGIDRPEGVAERWLRAADQGPAGRPQRYARDDITRLIVPKSSTPGALEVIEVGRGRSGKMRADVPFRVLRHDGSRLRAVAQLERRNQGWRVLAVNPADATLRLPSEGGPRLGAESPVAWAVAGTVAVGLTLGAATLIEVVRRTADPDHRAIRGL
jgi:hypothetical protein